MFRSLMAVLILLAFVLAGCLGGDDLDSGDLNDTDDGDGGLNGDGGDDGNVTTDPDDTDFVLPEPNRAPVATLESSTLEGDAPLIVNLTLDAEDPDGDDLMWTLDLGDGTLQNGTALPFSVEHSYGNGEFLVVFNVTDGEFHHAVNITITAVRLPNEVQAGSITLCQKHYILPLIFSSVPFNEDERVTVEEGTRWKVTADGDVQVQFWKEGGTTAGGVTWASEGLVPGEAATATICVALAGNTPYPIPDSGASFTYQDGFAA